MTGPTKEGLKPRVKDTALFLCKIYLSLTIVQVLLLLASDPQLSLFDAASLSLTSISTGGFAVRNACLSSYLNGFSLSILALFMILGGLNFSLYDYCIKGKFARLSQPELYYYFFFLALGSALIVFGLWNNASHFVDPPHEAYSTGQVIGYGVFQAISAQTSTGYSIVNYDAWPYVSQFTLILLMYVGGMSGSTSGGIKVIRFVIAWRYLRYKIETFFHRNVFRIITIGDKEISDPIAGAVLAFFCILGFLVVLGTYLLTLDNIDPLTSLAIISTTINNAGLFFGGIGCTESLAFLSPFSKIVAIVWMVLGRLELLTLLALLFPSFWKNR